jgi:hypothetical protein
MNEGVRASGVVAEGRRVVLVGGIQATDHKMSGVVESLGHHYSEVTLFNSPISTDLPNPNRTEDLQAALVPTEDGVTFASHSLGCADRHPDQIRGQDRTQVRTVFFSPSSGPRGIVPRARYFGRLVADKMPLGMGKNSLVAFPPANIPPEAIRELFSRASHVGKGYETVATIPLKDNRDRLTQAQIEALNETDTALADALRDNRHKKAKHLIRKRGGKKVVGEPLRKFYADVPEGEKKGKLRVGKDGLRTLFRGLSTKPIKEMGELAKEGYPLDVFVTEFDIVRPEWSGSEAKVQVMPGLTHDSILFQPGVFADVVAQGDRPQDAIMAS